MPIVIYGLSFVAGMFAGFLGNGAIHSQLEAIPTLGTGVVKIGDKWIFREDVIQYFAWIIVAISGFHHKIPALGYVGLGGLIGSMVTKVMETQTIRNSDVGTEDGSSDANNNYSNYTQESIGRQEEPARWVSLNEATEGIVKSITEFFNKLFFKESATTTTSDGVN